MGKICAFCRKMADMSDQSKTESSTDEQVHTYKILTAAALGLVALGTVIYRILEDWSWVDAFYFSVVTVTTVGFGDLAPSTDGGKLFTVAYIVTGVSIIATYLDARLKMRAHRRAPTTASNED
ncbi:MAG: hypothetical protein DRJ50_08340 [Actinobacteria bacterium]|nr:MAG: hypothetical protein DRJ50_08340 [Actinomycetota bacterium]